MPKPNPPKVMNGFQALAWISWRTEKAVQVFSGPDAEQLWDAARNGRFPEELGKPTTTPIAAEDELNRAVDSGALVAVTK